MKITRGAFTSDVIEISYEESQGLLNGRTIEGNGVTIRCGKERKPDIETQMMVAWEEARIKGATPTTMFLPEQKYKKARDIYLGRLKWQSKERQIEAINGNLVKCLGMDTYSYNGTEILIY
jgi:hypothetical protein